MISVQNLRKSYGERAVVEDVSLDFPAGKLTSLIGPNGAGKTTLLMMIGRLLARSSGDIRLEGEEIAGLRPADLARRIATLRQSPDFNLRLTVEELVAYGRFPYSRGLLTTEDHRAIGDALAFLEIGHLRTAYIDELSGGQRQMAFLAMTIAQQTDCLLLDEPLNNLDMKHAVGIMRALRRLCDEQGRTVILVVHDINFAANYSDHIVAMKGGRVFRAAPVTEVVNSACLRELFDLDFEVSTTPAGYFCNYFKPMGNT
tara:strand:+ start:558 stop:1331 length:774 start_codon:yes stop_codon:yes gene_type:complete